MFCRKCGTFVPEEAAFCPKCGTPTPEKAAPKAEPDSVPHAEEEIDAVGSGGQELETPEQKSQGSKPPEGPRPTERETQLDSSLPDAPQKRNNKIIFIVSASLLLICVAIGVLFLRGQNEEQLFRNVLLTLKNENEQEIIEMYATAFSGGFSIIIDPKNFTFEQAAGDGNTFILKGTIIFADTSSSQDQLTYNVLVEGKTKTNFLRTEYHNEEWIFTYDTPRRKEPPSSDIPAFDAVAMEGVYYSEENPDGYLDLTVSGGKLHIQLQSYRITEVDTSIELPSEPTFSAEGDIGTYTFSFDEDAEAIEVSSGGYTEWYTKGNGEDIISDDIPDDLSYFEGTYLMAHNATLQMELHFSSDVTGVSWRKFPGSEPLEAEVFFHTESEILGDGSASWFPNGNEYPNFKGEMYSSLEEFTVQYDGYNFIVNCPSLDLYDASFFKV